MQDIGLNQSWSQTLRGLTHPRVVTMLFLGFSAGIPILLIFSSLSLWLREAGVERAAVTYFSWAALGYSFKFIWAPLVDRLPIPLLTKYLGRRRSWMLLAQVSIIVSILMMAFTNPVEAQNSLTIMAIAAVLLGFSSATQDIVIDAYRIESASSKLQALMSSSYIAGYRIGMLVAGAGALFLAAGFGSSKDAYNFQAWQMSYSLMAATMLVGIVTTMLIKEPEIRRDVEFHFNAIDYIRFLLLFMIAVGVFITCFSLSSELVGELKLSLTRSFENKALASTSIEFIRLSMALFFAWLALKLMIAVGLASKDMLQQTYVLPVKDFFLRYGLKLAWLLLIFIGLYRVSDIVLGVISNVFYQDLGFTKPQIATVVKSFGLFMTIVGGFAGGLLAMRFGVLRILLLGAVLSALTNLLFMLLAQSGDNLVILTIVISADNLSAGLASAAFIAFLSSLTNITFTAVQYAIFSSLMTLLPKILGGYSGSMVDQMGYSQFFLLTALMGLPVIILILLLWSRFDAAISSNGKLGNNE